MLDDNIINQIAAGEVVERPASVVKELAENALDSGATQLTIEIKGGGTSYIRVSDNGRGIPTDSFELAFMRHATSKIRSHKDLEGVVSLGFRGEALASIAAVSQIEMTSMTSEDDAASYIRIEGGAITKRGEKGAAVGTSIIVRNLFYNTPARRKFLKSTRAERAHVQDIATIIALGRPDISITFINDGKTEFQTKGTDLRAAILQIMGLDYAKNLIDIDFQRDGFYVSGVAGRSEISRGNRNHEVFFINGRYVRSDLLSHTVENAYRTRLPIGRFPFCVLSLHVDPKEVDVNVHPTKLEVRFSDEALLREYVSNAVEEALQEGVTVTRVSLERGLAPAIHDYNPRPPENTGLEDIILEDNEFDTSFLIADDTDFMSEVAKSAAARSGLENKRKQSIHFYESKLGNDVKRTYDSSNIFTPPKKQHTQTGYVMPDIDIIQNHRIIGRFFGTYWMVERRGVLLVIDQHAAHERVLYDEIMDEWTSKGKVVSQLLIEPFFLHLNPLEEELLGDSYDYLAGLGFDIENFGGGGYGVRGIPTMMSLGLGAGFFADIIAKLGEAGTPENASAQERISRIAMMACKAAVKANDSMSERECQELIRKLLALPNPYTCPHGRPTLIEITKSEIERKFKRT